MNDLRARALLGLGVTLALVTGLLLYTTLSANAEQRDLRARQELVVARIAIAANAPIAQDALERRSYPLDLVPAGALTDPGALVGQREDRPAYSGLTLSFMPQCAQEKAIIGVSVRREMRTKRVTGPDYRRHFRRCKEAGSAPARERRGDTAMDAPITRPSARRRGVAPPERDRGGSTRSHSRRL